ncbi:MAG: sensor histidine kinase [Niabella sp.]
MRAEFKEQLLQSKIEIQEQAFNEISRELHDNIGQQLSLAKLNLNTLKGVPSHPDNEKIQDTKELITESIEQIRSIARTLLGEKVSSIGITEAIRNEAERINKTGVLSVSFHNNPPAFTPDPQKEIILFRIVQEAINNTLKHAKATNMLITIDYEPNKLKIFMQDNGKGFNLEERSGTGIGLMNMKSRAQTIGAVLHINSSESTGTVIEIILEQP